MAPRRFYRHNHSLIHFVTDYMANPDFALSFHILKNLPYTQFSFPFYSLQQGNLLFNHTNFTMVYQLPGSQAKAQVKKLLMSFLQLLGQVSIT